MYFAPEASITFGFKGIDLVDTSSLAKHNTDDLKPSVRETIVWNKNINPDFGIAVSAFDNIQDTYYYYQKESNRLYKNGNERNGVGEDREHEVNYDDMGT